MGWSDFYSIQRLLPKFHLGTSTKIPNQGYASINFFVLILDAWQGPGLDGGNIASCCLHWAVVICYLGTPIISSLSVWLCPESFLHYCISCKIYQI